MDELTVGEIMTSSVFAVAPDTDLETAARLLIQRRISGAPVVDAHRKAVGVVSLTDLADPDKNRGGAEGYPIFYKISGGWAEELGDAISPSEGRVEEVMTHAVVSVDSSASVADATSKLLSLGIHRMLVTNGDTLVGIVSSIDLLRAYHQGR
jgi:CBS domain-containing protein